MKHLIKFLQRPPKEQWLLIKVASLVGLIVLGLRLLPFQKLRYLLKDVSQRKAQSATTTRPTAEQVAHMVRVVSGYIPLASCLPQALAVELLYRRYDYPATFHIGVAKGANNDLEAHAWIESQGKIVIGHLQDLERFAQLPNLEEASL